MALKIGPSKSFIIKYVVHAVSPIISAPVSDEITGTPSVWAALTVAGSSTTVPIKQMRSCDVGDGVNDTAISVENQK